MLAFAENKALDNFEPESGGEVTSDGGVNANAESAALVIAREVFTSLVSA